MPTFYQTGGSKSDTLVCSSGNSGSFTVLWRAKDPKHRMRIAAIGKAATDGPAVNYSQGKRQGVYNALAKGKNYTARLNIAKNKLGGKYTDCSAFASACAMAGGAKMGSGLQTSSTIANGSFSNFTKHNAQKVFAAGTYQRGDIVSKGGFHAAVVAFDGPNCKTNFSKDYYSDGSKKIKNKKTEDIIKKYCKKSQYKKDTKAKAKQSKAALKKYLKTLKDKQKILKTKYNNNKNKTDKAHKEYVKKLKTAIDDINNAIDYVQKAIDNYKTKNKSRPKSKTTTTPVDNKGDNNNTNGDNGDTEPVILPEQINWYYVRSGLNYFTEEVILGQNSTIKHKDYMGEIYCKRKLRVPKLYTTKDYWEFQFDMPFTQCTSLPAGIKSAAMVSGNTQIWRYYLNKNNLGQVQSGVYTIKMKTSLGIEYIIRCDITTYYDV